MYKHELNYSDVSDLAMEGYINSDYLVYTNYEMTVFYIAVGEFNPNKYTRKYGSMKEVERFFEKIARDLERK